MERKKTAITLGVMCAMLTGGIIIQVKTINKTPVSSSIRTTNSELKDEVMKWKENYEKAYEELQNEEKKLEKVRQEAVKDNTQYKDTEEKLKQTNMFLGLTELKGEGVVITVEDNANANKNDEDIELEVQHNTDIIELVNELKNAGAEAIAVNGQRIMANTYINCGGTVINVDGKKSSSPTIISAIGNKASLSAIERPGAYIEYMEEYGLTVTIEKVNSVTIPKYNGVLSTKYMEPKK